MINTPFLAQFTISSSVLQTFIVAGRNGWKSTVTTCGTLALLQALYHIKAHMLVCPLIENPGSGPESMWSFVSNTPPLVREPEA